MRIHISIDLHGVDVDIFHALCHLAKFTDLFFRVFHGFVPALLTQEWCYVTIGSHACLLRIGMSASFALGSTSTSTLIVNICLILISGRLIGLIRFKTLRSTCAMTLNSCACSCACLRSHKFA